MSKKQPSISLIQTGIWLIEPIVFRYQSWAEKTRNKLGTFIWPCFSTVRNYSTRNYENSNKTSVAGNVERI